MKQYILQTIEQALSGDIPAILKCFLSAYIIYYLFSKIQEAFIGSRLKKINPKDMTRTPSQTKLTDRGYSRSIIDAPTRAKETE